ncbi:TPA: MFS transporter [Pseudomonas aeruginosa]|nr:MFS transporter [Pseudomonas aeruginosa]
MTETSRRTWFAIIVLCIASFTMVTSEFAPIGLLSQISSDLGRDPGAVGLTVTLYAWIGAGSGLSSGWINKRVRPKTLLVTLLIILAASNFLAAFCNELSTLIVSRAVGAVAHGIFWAMVAATAARIAPSHQVGLATSIVMGGITIATVIGVPVANLIGQYFGWRMAFIVLSLVAVLSAVLAWGSLPQVTMKTEKGHGLLTVFLERRDLRFVYGITALTTAAHFSAYAFIEPFIADIPEIIPPTIAFLLLFFGVMGFLGNILSAVFVDRYLHLMGLAALFSLALSLLGLGVAGPSGAFFLIVAFLLLWGMAISTLFTALQTWVLRISGDQVVPATAIHTAVLNVAIGLGVVCNGLVLEFTGINGAMLTGSLLVIPAIILMTISFARTTSNSPHEI